MRRAKGFTLVELLVVIAIIAMLMGILVPTVFRVLGMAKLEVCRANMKTVGTALLTYRHLNDQRWPWIDKVTSDWATTPTGADRDHSPAADGNNPGRRSVTSLMFLLVRSGESPGLFVCPADEGAKAEKSLRWDEDGNEDTDEVFYWDFSAARNVSYSWQAPVKKGDKYVNGIAGDEGEPIIMADKTPAASQTGWTPSAISVDSSPAVIRQNMSRTHAMLDAANALRADGSVLKLTRPDEGYQNDNIYTAGNKSNRGSRGAVSLDITQHLSARDSFLIGPVAGE